MEVSELSPVDVYFRVPFNTNLSAVSLLSVAPNTPPTCTGPHLLQLLLHHALLLRHVLELLRVLLGELPAGLLGGALLGRQGLLRLPVRADLLLEVFLLHLKELLGLLEPFFILLTL